METIPNIDAGQNQFINSGLIYGDDRTYSLTPTLTKTTGNHTLKAGANILYGEVNYFQNNTPGGTFTFTSAPTALDGTNPGSTGDPFASFLIGQPTTGRHTSHRASVMVAPIPSVFVQDSWQIHPRLTMNLGLRLEKPGVRRGEDRRRPSTPRRSIRFWRAEQTL